VRGPSEVARGPRDCEGARGGKEDLGLQECPKVAGGHGVSGSGGLTTPGAPRPNSLWGPYTGRRNGVSKGIEEGHRPPTLRVDHP
jgi:hypothetical protein